MSGRSWLTLGLLWGYPLGMATCRVLDHLETSAQNARPKPVPARVVDLTRKETSECSDV